jgi:hypothetical protein
MTPTAEQAARRAEFAQFADAEVMPHADRHDVEERVDGSLLKQLAARGYLASALPAGVGGLGLDPFEYGSLHEEIGRACATTRSLLTVHDMVADTIQRWAAPALRERWLPGLAAGEVIGALALSEADAGSNLEAIRCELRPHGDGFRLTGTKRWISFGQIADVMLVLARAGAGLTMVLVESDSPGVTVTPIAGMLGLRGSMLAELRFEDAPVSAESIVGPPGRAHPFVTTSALTVGRLSVAFGSVGIIQACIDECAGYAARRGLMEHQLVQRMLAGMIVDADAGRLLAYRAAEQVAARRPSGPMAATQAKYFASVAAGRATRDAVQIFGAAGCAAGSTVARLFRDAKIMEIIEGSNEIQRTTIASEAYRGWVR